MVPLSGRNSERPRLLSFFIQCFLVLFINDRIQWIEIGWFEHLP